MEGITLKKRIAATVIAFVFVAVCMLALSTPQQFEEYAVDGASDKIAESYDADDIDLIEDCTVNASGFIDTDEEAEGKQPAIVFELDGSECNSAVMTFGENTDGMNVLIFCDEGEGFEDAESTLVFLRELDTDYVIPMESGVRAVKLLFFEDCTLVSFETHNASLYLEKTGPYISVKAVAVSIFAALAVAAAVYITDRKFDYLSKLPAFNKGILMTFAKLTAALSVSFILGIVCELVFSKITASGGEASLNIYRTVFFTGIAFALSALIVFFKELSDKPEKAFVCISLTLGVLFIVLTPFGHACWDAESHYRYTINTSYVNLSPYYSLADQKVLDISDDYWPSQNAEENAQHIEAMNESYSFFVGRRLVRLPSPAHVPAGLFMALGRMARLSFYNVTNLSKFANVLFYCIVCYFAIRKLKSGKMIATVIALFPTSLYLAANLSYDQWVTSLGMLGMAYFLGIQQEKDGYVKIWDSLVMCGAFSLSVIPKLIYAPLMALPLLMNPKKIKNKKIYYFICIASIFMLGALLALKSLIVIKSGGDARGGTDVSSVGQIQFILSDPMGYVRILLNFLKRYYSFEALKEYTVNFAYLGIGRGAAVFAALMALTALTDKNEYDRKSYRWYAKAASIALFFGLSVLVATSMYVAFTPVGAQEIAGCQPRYLIPLLFPLLSVIGWSGLKLKFNRTVYNGGILAACAAVGFVNIYTQLLGCWV